MLFEFQLYQFFNVIYHNFVETFDLINSLDFQHNFNPFDVIPIKFINVCWMFIGCGFVVDFFFHSKMFSSKIKINNFEIK